MIYLSQSFLLSSTNIIASLEQIMSNRLYYEPVLEAEAYCLPHFQTLENQLWSNSRSQITRHEASHHQYCTLDSSKFYKSPSTFSFAPSGSSPTSQQDSSISDSCITDDVGDLNYKLKEIKSIMLGPDSDNTDSYDSNNLQRGTHSEIDCKRQKMGFMMMMPRGDLKQALIACAKALSNGHLVTAECLMAELRTLVSVSGEPIQRLGAYMLEGLVARLASSGSSICKALRCKEPASAELLSYMHILYEVCPYFCLIDMGFSEVLFLWPSTYALLWVDGPITWHYHFLKSINSYFFPFPINISCSRCDIVILYSEDGTWKDGTFCFNKMNFYLRMEGMLV